MNMLFFFQLKFKAYFEYEPIFCFWNFILIYTEPLKLW